MQKELDLLLEKAYCPYSHVQVSAIVKTKDGQTFKGVNIENASFTPTICAERNAIFQAVTKGYKKGDFLSLDLTANTKKPLYPCGVCRQVMSEFFDNDVKITVWKNGVANPLNLAALIPFAVTAEEIK